MIILDSVRNVVKSLPMRETIGKAVEPVRDNIKDLATSVISENTLNTVGPYVPMLGSAFGIVKTCIKVYNATSPANAIVVGVKGVLIDCTAPIIKYPALCAGIATCAAGACVTGDPNYIVGALEWTNAVIKQA